MSDYRIIQLDLSGAAAEGVLELGTYHRTVSVLRRDAAVDLRPNTGAEWIRTVGVGQVLHLEQPTKKLYYRKGAGSAGQLLELFVAADGSWLKLPGERQNIAVGGVEPQLDDTDKMAVSAYGKATNPGDTPLLVSPAGRVLSAVLSTIGGTDAEGVRLFRDEGDNGRVAAAANYLFNGSTFDRERSNTGGTVLSSAARTASVNSADQTNHNARGLVLVIDVTAIAATPSVVFTIKGQDPVSGKYWTILTSAAITGAGTTVLRVYPGLTAVPNLVANDVIPRLWRLEAVHADADSITYSARAEYVL